MMRALQPDAKGQVQIDGVRIDWYRRGSGQPLLLLNSIEGVDRNLPYMRALAEHFDVIAPQHPGFGQSELPREFRSVEDLANFYLTLIERIDLTNAILVGASFGGWLAAEIAVRSCTRFSSLVMIDPLGVKVSDRTRRDISDLFSVSQKDADRLLCWNLALSGGEVKEELLSGLARSHQALGQFGWSPYMHNPSLRRWLRRIDIPALFVRGEDDPVISLDYVRAFAAELPNAVVKTIPAAGHYPHIDNPDALMALLLAHAGVRRSESLEVS